jgi:16S rRNA (cytosine967-C5)-methyltransferase
VGLGGLLAYATCTVTPAENERAVEAFLASEAGAAFAVEEQAGRPFFATQLVPGGCDAHFLALLRRKG